MQARRQSTSYSKIIAVLALLIVVAGAGYYASSRQSSHSTRAAKTPPKTTAHIPSSQANNAPQAHTDAALQQILTAWAGQHSFSASISVAELTGSLRTAQLNQTAPMTTASTYKIYVAYAALHQVEQGKITMNTTTRTGQTVSQALSKMILQSDNDSAEALGFLVGWNTINSLAASVGATHTNINNYDSAGNPTNGNKQSTAQDLTIMVTKLQQGTLLNAGNTQLLLGLMKTQEWRERIPAGVPSGVAVADKPGWLDNVENDAAIVYGPKSTYTLVIMTNGSTTQPLDDLSRLIYNYLET